MLALGYTYPQGTPAAGGEEPVDPSAILATPSEEAILTPQDNETINATSS